MSGSQRSGSSFFASNRVWAIDASWGDGTTDRRSALQAIIDSAEAASGGTIVLPPGTFILGSPASSSDGGLRVKTANPNLIIQGAGMGRTILKAKDNISIAMTGIIRTTSGLAQTGLTLRDLTLDGNRANQTATTIGFFSGVSPNTVCDVAIAGTTATLSNFGGTGAAHGITNGATIFVDSYTQPGLYGDYVFTVVNSTSGTITVVSGLSNETGVAMYKTTEALSQDYDILLERVEARNCKNGGSGGYGFDPHERTRRIRFIDCVAHDNDGPGFALDGCRDFQVKNCHAYNNEGEAVAHYTRTRDGVVEGLTGYGNGHNLGGSALSSLGFEGSATNIVVSNAKLRDGYGNGSTIAFSASQITLKSCTFDNMQNYGIQIRAASDCLVDGCTITDAGQATNNTYDGIYFDGGQATNQRNTAINNKIRSTRTNKVRYGINVGSSAVLDAVMANNDILYDNTGSGQIENVGTRSKVSSAKSAGHHPGIVSARWYTSPRLGTTGTLLTVADRLYATPIYIPAGARINRWAMEITTGAGVGGSTFRMGLYTSNKGVPDKLILDTGTGTTSTTTGVKIINPADIRVEGGLYWICGIGNGNATMPTVTAWVPEANNVYGANWLGLAALGDIDDATLTPVGYYYTDAGVTYVANGLPTTFPTPTGIIVNANVPVYAYEAGA